jgi:CMP-N,N'-diacetyllegionaminic acid synthase
MTKPRILGLIPARGGSKGVPRKNVRPIAGKPLIAYTIETALQARDLFHRIIVSTDDTEIARIAAEHGAEVPFLRPRSLAGDAVATLPVVQHAVRWIEEEEGEPLEWICLLQPSDPLRIRDDIEAAIRLALQGGADSVISVVQAVSTHPCLMKRIENNRLQPFCIEEKEGTRRQDLRPPAYMRNGAIYLTRRDVVMHRNSLWGSVVRPLIMPENRSHGIDSEVDFHFVEFLLTRARTL